MQGIKTGGYHCGVGRHCGRREREVSEEVPFKLRHERRLDNFMSVPTAGFTLETNTRACSESRVWNSWPQISTGPLTLLATRSHFSRPLLIYYFPNLQYLPSSHSAEDPASYSTKERVALTNCLENKIFSRCPPPRWPLMLPFSFLLLSMNLLGDYTRFSFYFDPRSFALWLSLRWLQLHSPVSPTSCYFFLSLINAILSRLSENGTCFSSHPGVAQVLAMATKLTKIRPWFSRTLTSPPPSRSPLAWATLASWLFFEHGTAHFHLRALVLRIFFSCLDQSFSGFLCDSIPPPVFFVQMLLVR